MLFKYAGRHALKRNPWVWRQALDLKSRECAPPAQHRARQKMFLEQVFRSARDIPAYAGAAARVSGKDRLASLSDEFPIIDKTSLLRDRTDFFPGGKIPKYRSTVAATSGTTGTPLDVYRSFGSIVWEEAFHLQHWHWAGWNRGQRQAVLRGEIVVPIDRRDPPFWFRDPIGGQLVLSTRHLDRHSAALFAGQLRQFDATQLRAYPSAAYELATLIAETGVSVRFNSVITGSEMLYDFQRQRIESVFNARVHDFYSMAERVAFASQCEQGRMHVNPEYGVLEIVDDHGRPTDGEGNIVGTSLHNRVAPLIRYRMNDTARWSHEPCPCGRTYPVIENLGGRLADQLHDLDGRAVNGTVIGFAFDGMRHIDKAQVVQSDAGRWLIRIVPGRGYSGEDGQRVLDKLAAEVSSRVATRIELVDHIPLQPNGKYKWVAREYHRETPDTGSARRSACPVRVAGTAW